MNIIFKVIEHFGIFVKQNNKKRTNHPNHLSLTINILSLKFSRKKFINNYTHILLIIIYYTLVNMVFVRTALLILR